MRPRDEIKQALEASFRKEFPQDTVDISNGWADNIHLLVVSRKFDGMPESIRQDLMWTLVKRAGLDDEETRLVSLALTFSPGELK
jgi:hypothetical protein